MIDEKLEVEKDALKYNSSHIALVVFSALANTLQECVNIELLEQILNNISDEKFTTCTSFPRFVSDAIISSLQVVLFQYGSFLHTGFIYGNYFYDCQANYHPLKFGETTDLVLSKIKTTVFVQQQDDGVDLNLEYKELDNGESLGEKFKESIRLTSFGIIPFINQTSQEYIPHLSKLFKLISILSLIRMRIVYFQNRELILEGLEMSSEYLDYDLINEIKYRIEIFFSTNPQFNTEDFKNFKEIILKTTVENNLETLEKLKTLDQLVLEQIKNYT